MPRLLALLTLLASAASAFAQSSHVKGTIVWDGDVPPVELHNVGNAVGPYCLSKGPIRDETFTIDPKHKGMQWVYVWLAPKDPAKPLPVDPLRKTGKGDVEIGYDRCVFVPHAVALQEGQALVVTNNSKVSHNFKYTGNPAQGTGNPAQGTGNSLLPPGPTKRIEHLKADRFPWILECNIHPWMRGMMMIFDHPYFALTDADGRFEIKDAPAGQWQLMVRNSDGQWLGGAKGRTGRTIQINAGGTDLGAVAFPPP